MAALERGTTAPRFALNDVDDGTERSPAFSRPTLLVFYKTTCPTCKLALPYIEAFKAYGEAGLDLLAVAEDPPELVQDFRREYGSTLPTLEDVSPYSVSSEYGLTNVPTVFLVEPGGRIADSIVGFSKQGLNAISDEVARFLGVAPVVVAPANDGAPDWKPG